jgi:8-oxo-dGTP pyrophosphatase MutT (NUDIX family)
MIVEHLTSELTAALRARPKGIIADWDLKPAAVLVPLFYKDDGYHLLFTRRTDHLRHHPGQISFPGGRREDSDATLLDTALREAEEEIGLKREHVAILGELDDMMTSTFFRISPFVGIFNYPYQFVLNRGEIGHLVEVPIAQLMEPSRLEIRIHEFNNNQIPVYYYHIGNEPIWGATARIVKSFLEIIAPLLVKKD